MKLLALPMAVAGLALLGAAAPGAHPPGHPGTSYLGVVPGAVVSQGFGCTPFELEPAAPQCPTGHIHTGIDLAAPTGTPVLAAGPGNASITYSQGGYGLHIVLRHDERWITLYGHLSAVVVGEGQWVDTGQLIGRVGSTGMSTGPHLHLEVRRDGRPVDPSLWLPLPLAGSGKSGPG
jgi:murein DD-endopeptidase MepM/ murein hydrolase activator NlpD